MQKRVLGRSGLEVSALGMGCWAIGGPWTWDQPGREPYPAGWGDADVTHPFVSLRTFFVSMEIARGLDDYAPPTLEMSRLREFMVYEKMV